MKLLPALFLFLSFLNCFPQQKEFELEGIIVDSTSTPIADVYIINMRTQEKSVCKTNGVFNVKVLPGDTLGILHIAYKRKFVRVFDLMKNPLIQLNTENVNIGEVNVSASQQTDYEKVMNNISSISETKFNEAPKIDPTPNQTSQLMIEHNKVLRSEATSLRLLRFSPSDFLGKVLEKMKKKKDRKKIIKHTGQMTN